MISCFKILNDISVLSTVILTSYTNKPAELKH